jgi:hypothetical protein
MKDIDEKYREAMNWEITSIEENRVCDIVKRPLNNRALRT